MPQRIADDVWIIPILPDCAINAYLLGDVLLDAGIRETAPLLLRWLRGHRLHAHALTHGHPDHQGGSAAICAAFDVALWCGSGDAPAVATGRVAELLPPWWLNRLHQTLWAGPAYPVSRVLREGDVVAGFRVLETPGHSPGHLAFWRAEDGVLLLGDVLANAQPFTGRPGLREPTRWYTPDPARNRESARRLAALEPRLVGFGHGPPLRNPRQLAAFVAQLE